jgi:uncharacterized protein (DUF58 family)
VTGPLGFLVADGSVDAQVMLSVYPSAQALRRLVEPREPHAYAGNQLARVKDSGREFAELRPFHAGDRARDVNWRATARTGSIWVNQRHPDRSTDVILLVDAFSDAVLPAAVRAASALARAYLEHRDRVGLVSIGGVITWMRPGGGTRQEYLLVQTLLDTSAFVNVADKTISQVPPNVIPRKALVFALSPLEDERFVRALVDLRSRGIDVVALEVSPLPYTDRGRGSAGDIAYRLWVMQRDVTRSRLREMGIPVVVWTEPEPLAPAVEEVAAWPRVAQFVGSSRVGPR